MRSGPASGRNSRTPPRLDEVAAVRDRGRRLCSARLNIPRKNECNLLFPFTSLPFPTTGQAADSQLRYIFNPSLRYNSAAGSRSKARSTTIAYLPSSPSADCRPPPQLPPSTPGGNAADPAANCPRKSTARHRKSPAPAVAGTPATLHAWPAFLIHRNGSGFHSLSVGRVDISA